MMFCIVFTAVVPHTMPTLQVQLAQLRHELSRLVRETTSHGRGGFGAGGSREVVSERQRGHSGSECNRQNRMTSNVGSNFDAR